MGQLGDGRTLGAAQRFSRQATKLQPDWPAAAVPEWSRLSGAGALARRDWVNLGTWVGFSAFDGAANLYIRALSPSIPDTSPALRALGVTSPRSLQDTTLIGGTGIAGRFVTLRPRRHGKQAGVLLARARFERLMADADSSLAALRVYAALENRSGVALHQLRQGAALAGTKARSGCTTRAPNPTTRMRSPPTAI